MHYTQHFTVTVILNVYFNQKPVLEMRCLFASANLNVWINFLNYLTTHVALVSRNLMRPELVSLAIKSWILLPMNSLHIAIFSHMTRTGLLNCLHGGPEICAVTRLGSGSIKMFELIFFDEQNVSYDIPSTLNLNKRLQ